MERKTLYYFIGMAYVALDEIYNQLFNFMAAYLPFGGFFLTIMSCPAVNTASRRKTFIFLTHNATRSPNLHLILRSHPS